MARLEGGMRCKKQCLKHSQDAAVTKETVPNKLMYHASETSWHRDRWDVTDTRNVRSTSCSGLLLLVMRMVFVFLLLFVGLRFLLRSGLGHKLFESHEVAFFLWVTFGLSPSQRRYDEFAAQCRSNHSPLRTYHQR